MHIKTYAPIIIPTLNRYEHFRRCVESLAQCTGADKTEIIIGIDYPPSDKYVDGWKMINDYLSKITGFKKVTIFRRNQNFGSVNNSRDLEEYACHKFGRFIFTEDDNEFSPNFLEYINWGLEEFKDDNSIFAICGFKKIETDDIKNNVYKLNTIFSAWGYGSWADRSEKFYHYHDHEYIRRILKESSIFDAFSPKVGKLSSLTYQLANKTFFGDVIVGLLPKNEKWCIFPSVNKVRNWGWDGSGEHGGSSELIEKYSSMPIDKDEHFEPVVSEDIYNLVVLERYRKKYRKSKKKYIRAAITFLSYKMTGYIPVANKNNKWCKVKLLKVQ